MRARTALLSAVLAGAVAVRSSLRLRLPQQDVDRCFPFRGNFHNGCAFVDAMCEKAKFPEDVMAPSWCSTYAHDTHGLWQECEHDVQMGDEVQPFVDSDQWTALWDQGGSWATYDAKCHWEDPSHCKAVETLAFSRAPNGNYTAPPPGTLFPEPPKPDFFVVSGNSTGNRTFLVDNGKLVESKDGALVPAVTIQLNGRGELIWNDGTTSRREGGPLPGYGLGFVTCMAQQAAPPCVEMCAGHTPAGPCPQLCLALAGCRVSCSQFGSDSRYDVQSCVNSCLIRTAPKENLMVSTPCPAKGCDTFPAPPPSGLTPAEGQALEWQLGNMSQTQELMAESLANATVERDAMKGQFKDLLVAKIADQDPNAVQVPVDVLAGNATNATNATNASAPMDAASPVPVPAPAPDAGAPERAAEVERVLSPAAEAQMEALAADIASTQASVNAVHEESAAYQEQINILNTMT